jgi:hypothetical protein
MSQVFKLIGIGFGLAALLVIAVGFLLPSRYTITRSVVIGVPVEQVHRYVGDLEQWPLWTPWLASDPSTVITPGALSQGKGAHFSWTTDSGGGELTFSRSQPDWGVAFDMTLGKDKRLTACSLLYRPIAQGTEVTWQMQGDSGLDILGRYFNLLLNPLMGPMLDDGLQQLKSLVEQDATEQDAAEQVAPGEVTKHAA